MDSKRRVQDVLLGFMAIAGLAAGIFLLVAR